jgi:3-methyladenine DNA glycosylase AlkD
MIDEARAALRGAANPARAEVSRSYFKTGPGQYGEGDIFLGISTPEMRRLARNYAALTFEDLACLISSPVHEERSLALLILVNRFGKADAAARKRIYAFYMRHARYVNNWDLVDCSAPYIVGPYLEKTGAAPLDALARSPNLWRRRIAMVATLHFTRNGDPAPALHIAEFLLADRQDLIHKAAGWMLREAGKRCGTAVLEGFLARHAAVMPRTMLRYSIERFPEERRRYWMAAGVSTRLR